MTSSAIEREPLGFATLNRKWYVDVDTSATSTPSWAGVFGIGEFKANIEPTLQADSDYDSEGYLSETITALKWSLDFKVTRKTQVSDPEAYDPGQEALRLASESMGPDAVVRVRWYEMTPGGPRVEAYEGLAVVSWTPDGGDVTALDRVSVRVIGRGKRIPIAHPDAA
ncbi:phage tail tube protein [Nocardioides zeae]